jgi:divalent metal cation (Fe/Co/Zn/Cd) transporter
MDRMILACGDGGSSPLIFGMERVEFFSKLTWGILILLAVIYIIWRWRSTKSSSTGRKQLYTVELPFLLIFLFTIAVSVPFLWQGVFPVYKCG